MSELLDNLRIELAAAAARIALVAKALDVLPVELPDNTPLRDVLFAHWPTLGDVRLLRRAVENVARHVETNITPEKGGQIRLTVTLVVDKDFEMTPTALYEHVQQILDKSQLNPKIKGFKVTAHRESRRLHSPEISKRIR